MVRLSGSGLSWGAFRPSLLLAFAARLLVRNLRGSSFGVWPFSLPLPPVCWFATFVVRLSGSGLSWGALRPSLLALQLSRGLLLLFPRLSGLSFCFNYGCWLYLGGLIITGPKYVILQSASLAEFFQANRPVCEDCCCCRHLLTFNMCIVKFYLNQYKHLVRVLGRLKWRRHRR